MKITKDGIIMKKIRMVNKLSQKELAEKIIFLNQSQICKIENGKRKLSVDELMKICEILKLNPKKIVQF